MKLVVGTFMTLDGVMQAPGEPNEDTEGGFTKGGWQRPFFDADAGKIMGETMATTSALLLGRKTYQIFAAFWPFAPKDDPAAGILNSIPKYVVSTTLDRAEWNNSALIRGNVAQEVARVKQSGPGILSVTGSGKLAQSLMQYNLVDEYVLWIHPIVLGSGKRLFAEGVAPANFKLSNTRTTGAGVVILTYQPAEK
jgi:dihydrofolate reductase